MFRFSMHLFCGVLIAAFVVGCGDDEPIPQADVSLGEGTASEAALDSIPLEELKADSSESQPATETDAPATADAAMQKLIDGVKAGKYEAYWEFFPASYQKDLNNLAQEFASNADPELWSALFTTLQKTSGVMKTKKEFILESPLFDKFPVTSTEVSNDWDSIHGLITLLASSELADQEKAKKIDLGEFLKGTGGEAVKHLLAMSHVNPGALASLKDFTNMKVSLLSSGDDIALLTMEPAEGLPVEVEWVRIEGKWFPRELARNWKESIEYQRKAILDSLSGEDPKGKQRFLAALNNFNLTLDGLEKADNQDDFDAAMTPIIAMAELAAMSLGPQRPTATPPTDSLNKTAIIVIEEEITPERMDNLLEMLVELTDNPDEASYVINPTGTTKTIMISPVSDLKTFAAKVSDAQAEVLDPVKRTVRLKQPKNEGKQ